MKEYRVGFVETDKPEYKSADILLFYCQADDTDHAVEQCKDAYPEARIAFVTSWIDWRRSSYE